MRAINRKGLRYALYGWLTDRHRDLFVLFEAQH